MFDPDVKHYCHTCLQSSIGSHALNLSILWPSEKFVVSSGTPVMMMPQDEHQFKMLCPWRAQEKPGSIALFLLHTNMNVAWLGNVNWLRFAINDSQKLNTFQRKNLRCNNFHVNYEPAVTYL